MPLTIKPANFVSALHVAEFPEIVETGALHIWIGTVDYALDSNSQPVSFTTKGFIHTSKSMIQGAHNCDNLQLEGDLIDFRHLKGIATLPFKPPILRNPYNLVHLLDANSGTYYPCHKIVSWGEQYFFTGVDYWSGYPKLCAILTNSNNCYCQVTLRADGGTATGPSYNDTNLIYMMDGIKAGPLRCKSQIYHINMMGITRTIENFRNVLIPRILDQLNSGWEKTPMTIGTMNAPFYQDYSPFASGSHLNDIYYSSEYNWLSALEEYTSKRVDFGELHYRALSKIDTFSSNGIAYLKDLTTIVKDFKSLYQTLRGNVSPKSLADLFLSFKYGFPQTYQDSKDVVAAIKATKHTSTSVTDTVSIAGSTIETTTTIRYKPLDGTVEDIYNVLRQLDLLISAENVWELIPFSFVVDWFVDIDGKLDRLDQLDHLSHLKIDAVYDSQILTTSCASSRFINGITGTIDVRRFQRYCSDDASFPLIVSTKPSLISHWLEGTALIIQRLFK